MSIAVLGAAGQLGRDLCPRLPDVVPLTRSELDLARPETILPAIETRRPTILVNCAAYNFVDKAEAEPEVALAVNGLGVRLLARACKSIGCTLVHISTDYVFGLNATRATPWTEADAPGPVSVYGASKLLGEYAVLAEHPGNLVVRTCGLYGVWGSGGKGGNFVETMLRVAGQGKPLRVVNDQRCTPSYTVDVAATIVGLIRAGASGLFHATNGGSCSWYEFAAEIFRQAGVTADLTPIPTSERNDPARRPPFSVLSNTKLATVGVAEPQHWTAALAAYLAERGRK